MIISPHDQGTPEWVADRIGKPTGSCFKEILTGSGQRSKSRIKYMYRLAGERVSGEQYKGFYGKDMEMGHEREDESRKLYELVNGVTVEEVGLCYKDEQKLFGASPDGLVGDDGGFETKNAAPHVQAERLDKGWSGSEYKMQCMGNLLVTGRKWWDLVSYCRGMKPVVIRFQRDEEFLRKLEIELRLFCKELDELVKKISY